MKFHYGYHYLSGELAVAGKPPVADKSRIFKSPGQLKKATKQVEKAIARLKEVTPSTVMTALSTVAVKYPAQDEVAEPLSI